MKSLELLIKLFSLREDPIVNITPLATVGKTGAAFGTKDVTFLTVQGAQRLMLPSLVIPIASC
tara:strand:+ start:139 stop:327 length:189 start_codon:yes stop_codon:yes gene_type:complete